MLPELRTIAGFNALREAGYGFSNFDRPQNFKMQAEILDVAIKTTSALTTEQEIIKDTAYLVLDSLFAAPKGFEFFLRFPKEEVGMFCRLAVENRTNGLTIPMVAPVCPDYRGHYQLFDEVDDTAERVMNNLITLKDFFGKRNFPFRMQMHVADVEAFEPLILRASGETTESFLRKTSGSIAVTQARIYQLGLEGIIQCGSMLDAFSQAGVDYFALKKINTQEIMNNESKKVKRTIEALTTERVRLGDFDLVDQNNHKQMAAEELVHYAVYGDLIDGQAVILSPDTLSPMPAYNFLRNGKSKLFNPTIYLKPIKASRELYES